MADVALTVSATYESANRWEVRQNSVEFGDGYAQDAPDGINNLVEVWDVVTPLMSTTDMDTLVALLVSAQSGGVRLTWTPPITGASSKRWRVPKNGWVRHRHSFNVEYLTFTLREAF